MKDVKNILDDVFKKPEPEVRLFSELMRTPVQEPAKAKKDGGPLPDKITSGRAEGIRAAQLIPQRSGNIIIQHGWDGDDYVWHIKPTPQRQWKVSIDRVIYAIAKTMHQTIPKHIKVNIFRPYSDWEIKEITFKAHGLGTCWNVRRKDVDDMTGRVFGVLNPLV